MHVPVKPELVRWARERAGLGIPALSERFRKLSDWEEGTVQPTLRQLEDFARTVHVPIGYLFLPEPPVENLPIPDFRTRAGHVVARPSPDLLDMIYACQERQGWYREFAQVMRQPALPFVGSATTEASPEQVATQMRETLGFDFATRRNCSTWIEALRLLIKLADDAGIMVMVSGVVLSNNRRTLNPDEFQGFALADSLAPLVFINGADTKAAQIFTLAHELAHLWLGASALSDAGVVSSTGYRREEVWCNQVAAELLVPLSVLSAELWDEEPLGDTLKRLARHFKVSTLVILRRLLDVGRLNYDSFKLEWDQERERLRNLAQDSAGGGNFYHTTVARVGRRFTRALVESTLEGQTLYRDAFRMLGVSKTSTFENIGRAVGVLP
jgi:Zn-dependent peptidase ImmA (M78 family)/transcriptional regulator with XRE-family HTH domain